MYPRISDIFNDLFNTDIFLLPIQSFGFMVAVAFMVAYYFLKKEMERKQALGIFATKTVKVNKGGPMPATDILIQFAIFGLLGYKIGLMFDDYRAFAFNPQEAILSTKGSIPYGILFGLLAAAYQFYFFWKRKDDKVEVVEEQHGIIQDLGVITTLAFVFGILGAKIFHNLENWDTFWVDPINALISFDGLTIYGGLICAGAAIIYYIRKRGYPIWPAADAFGPALMISYGVGRIGCQLAGDGDWGIPNTAPKPDWLSFMPDWMWSFTYPHNVLKDNPGNRIADCAEVYGEYCYELLKPVWPTPFYETVMAFALFGLLWALRKRLKLAGQMFGLYLIVNGIERFFIEKIRVNNPYDLFGMEVTQAEIISSVFFIAGALIFYLATYRWKIRDPEPESSGS
ncbi:MAG: prolipoprotein diacylglyceryl transferase family protein [Bacteroidota bacterium]